MRILDECVTSSSGINTELGSNHAQAIIYSLICLVLIGAVYDLLC